MSSAIVNLPVTAEDHTMNRTTLKLFCMSHHIPVSVKSDDAIRFYRTVARIHGYSLVRSAYGYVLE